MAVLGASNYTYAEATWTQQLPDWIGSHVRTFEFMGGVTEILVPDNLKSGVKHPSYCRHSAFVELDRPALKALPADRYAQRALC